MLLKNLGGTGFEPGNAMSTFDPSLGPEGGLFEESAQDQQLNPGGTDEPLNPLLPPYLAPFMQRRTGRRRQPELDEPFAGINTLTDVAMLEGFIDVLGPINPGAVKNEALNMGETELMGTWPTPNRVLRDGAFKAPQLRDVELTGPYFHNGGTLTLRQVVDFYTRGGDFPITNAAHRDFLLTNLDIEAQSNLSEEEKVALVDFLLELTDDRVAFDRAPFDHPEVIIPVDGKAPDNTMSRAALLAATTGELPRWARRAVLPRHPGRRRHRVCDARAGVPESDESAPRRCRGVLRSDANLAVLPLGAAMLRHLECVVMLLCVCGCQIAAKSGAEPPRRLGVFFKLDSQLVGGTYGGDRWVSPATFAGVAQPGHHATVEARVDGVEPRWTPADPDLLIVSPVLAGRFDRVRITAKHAGQTRLKVTTSNASALLDVKAKPIGTNATQIEITQTGGAP